MITVVIVLVVIIIIYLFALKPNQGRKKQMEPFEKVYIAHRGLFNREDAPENSKKAFHKAVEAGYGIELDVQLSKDDRMVVFHDPNLKRMCQIDRRVSDCTYEELQQYHLGESEETIPLFEDVLKIIDGKVPLIVEIKAEGHHKNTARYLSQMMKSYQGIYCIESFHPMVVAWYRWHEPEVIRGQLATNFWIQHKKEPAIGKFVLTNMLLNFLARPDFIAFNFKYANLFSYTLCRKLFHVENVAWTIHSQKELKQAKKYFDVFIFDSFIPE